jgi:hypothetical protein
MEISVEALQKIKNRPPHYSTIPLLGICPQKPKSVYYTDNCIPMFIAALLTIAEF